MHALPGAANGATVFALQGSQGVLAAVRESSLKTCHTAR
jgi:hypothetical protein